MYREIELARIHEAAHFAIHRHHGQTRNEDKDVPYVTHCAEVAGYVATAGGTCAQVQAAWLHDTVEDTDTQLSEINALFGKDVAELVEWLTDVSKPEDGNRALRKSIDRDHTAMAPPAALSVKCADLISNTQSIVAYKPDFAVVYMREKQLLLPHLAKADIPSLFQKAQSLVNQYFYLENNVVKLSDYKNSKNAPKEGLPR